MGRDKKKVKEYAKEYYSKNRLYVLAENKLWYKRFKSDPYQQRRRFINSIKSRLGISWNQFCELVLKSEGRCDICGFSGDDLCIDHDHKTGVFRGMLCQNDNRILGFIEKYYLARKETIDSYLKGR